VSTINGVEISFDPAKSEKNLRDRGLPFDRVAQFDWLGALVVEDARKDYGERRFRVLGQIEGRLHALVFTPRAGRVHVISLRKANQREVQQYEQKAGTATPRR